MTVTQIIAAVRRQTLLTTADISDSNITILVNEGYRHIASLRKWPWLTYDTSDVDTVADQVEYDMPADYLYLVAIVQTDKNNFLQSVSFRHYLQAVGDNPSSSTTASHYYIRGDKLGLYPTPSANDTAAYKILYYTTFTDLAAGDSPPWNSMFHQILVDYCTFRIYEREEMRQEQQLSASIFDQGLRNMSNFYDMRDDDFPIIFGDGRNHFISSNATFLYGP